MKEMSELLNFGLVNIDKPAGPTSFSVSEFVRRELGLSKTSHMGTLDPKVTGVLPITLGRACKLAGYFIRHDKSYVGVLETHRACDIVELQKLIDANFVGKIRQTPPHRSAVARVEREREVFFWKLLEAGSPSAEEFDSSNRKSSSQGDGEVHASRGDLGNIGKSFLFECKVEGGTYVRKLCSDLGEMIGGAHMASLRRIKAGIFSEGLDGRGEVVGGRLVDLYEFEKAIRAWRAGDEGLLRGMIVPAEDAICAVLPVVEVDKSAVKSLYIGRPVLKNNILQKVGSREWRVESGEIKTGDSFALFCGEVFIGVYRATGEDSIFGRVEFVKN